MSFINFLTMFFSILLLQKCKICNINIWEHQWESNKNITKINCDEPFKSELKITNSVSYYLS